MHRAESILSAVETALTGLLTTGANVARGRAYAVPILPAISIFKGSDQSSENQTLLGSVMREMTVNLDIHVQGTGNPETELNQIAAEIYAALVLDHQQGLAYVYDSDIVGDDEPEIEGTQDLPIARMRSTWLILYEHSLASAE